MAVYKVTYQSIFMESWLEGESVVGKSTQARGMTTAFRNFKQNQLKCLCKLHKEWTEAEFSASRANIHKYVQKMGYKCYIQDNSETASKASNLG